MNKNDIQILTEAYSSVVERKVELKEADLGVSAITRLSRIKPAVDPDIETVFDMVIGDYLAVLGDNTDFDEFTGTDPVKTFESLKRGLFKLGKLANVDIKKYDVDHLL